MAATAAQQSTNLSNARVRVRTPGKYIVLAMCFAFAIALFGAKLWRDYSTNPPRPDSLEMRETAGGELAVVTLPEFLVDLSPDRNGRTAYLKLKASIVLDTGRVHELAAVIDRDRPLLVERLTFFLRELRPEDFQGTAAMARLKKEMVRRVNLVISPEVASDVVIEEFVIQ